MTTIYYINIYILISYKQWLITSNSLLAVSESVSDTHSICGYTCFSGLPLLSGFMYDYGPGPCRWTNSSGRRAPARRGHLKGGDNKC